MKKQTNGKKQVRWNRRKVTGILLVISLALLGLIKLGMPENAEQFVQKNFLIPVRAGIDLLEGKREENGVFKGQDHYLLEGIAEEKELSKNSDAMRSFAEEYPKVSMYVMLVPGAATILEDKMPKFAITGDQSRQFQKIQTALGEQLTWVDAEKALKTHAKEDIYYRTDTRWTSLGAYYAYQELAASMQLDETKAPKRKAYAVSNDFTGNLSARSGYETGYGETIYIYAPDKGEADPEIVVEYVDEDRKTPTLYDVQNLKEKEKYNLFMGGDYAQIRIRTTADTRDRLLLVKDSYANCLLPFLLPYYREIIMIDPVYYDGKLQDLMEENKITSVLFLYGGNHFAEDNSISEVLSNGKTE